VSSSLIAFDYRIVVRRLGYQASQPELAATTEMNAQRKEQTMNGEQRFLGTVEHGQFHVLMPVSAAGATLRFTRIAMQEAVPPESKDLPLAQYEGQAIMLSGLPGGEWVYSATVIDRAGPILTQVVQQVFG